MLRSYCWCVFFLYFMQNIAFASVCLEAERASDKNIKIQLYTRCIESSQFDSDQTGEMYLERGYVFANSKQWEKAIEDFSMCIQMRPTDNSAYYNRARVYNELKMYEKALSDVEYLLRLTPNTPQLLHLRGNIFLKMLRHDDALNDFSKEIDLWKTEDNVKKDDISLAHYNRAITYYEKKDFKNAKIDIDMSISLDQDPNYYNLRSMIYYNIGDYDNAIKDLEKIIQIDPNFKNAKDNLYKLKNGYPQASKKMDRALEEAKEFENNGEYSLAIERYEEVLENGRKLFSDKSIVVYANINTMLKLITLYDMLGRYNDSMPLYKILLQYCSDNPGSDIEEYFLGSLANAYDAIGDPKQAVTMRQRVIAIHENSEDPSLLALAIDLTALAMSEIELGNYNVAKEHLDRAYSMSKRIAFEDGIPTIRTKIGLAYYYMVLEQYDQAETILLKELQLIKGLDYPEPDIEANVLMMLAEIREHAGDVESAERLMKDSLSLREKYLGKESNAVARTLQKIGSFRAHQGDYKAALDLMLASQTTMDKFIDRILSFTTEKQQLTFLDNQSEAMGELFSLVNGKMITDKRAVQQCFEVWLRRKGLVLETQKQFQQALFSTNDPVLAKIFDELQKVRTNISYNIFAGPKKNESKEDHQKKIDQLEVRKQTIEEEILSRKGSASPMISYKEIKATTISQLLPKGSVMIEIVKTRLPLFFEKENSSQITQPHYLAFVLPAKKLDNLALVDLGEADKIEEELDLLRRIMSHPKEVDPQDSDTYAAVAKASNSLFKLVFLPLRRAIGEARQVYLSPDGALNLLPFEVLQDENGRFLIQDFAFTYLATGRDILSFGSKSGNAGKNLIIGNPDFDLDGQTKQKILDDLNISRSVNPDVRLSFRERRRLHFDPLPGTQQEVDAIKEIIGTKNSDFFTGKMAVEELLTRRTAPGILHLATHGFFLPDQQLSSYVQKNTPDQKSRNEEQAKFENPLVRSGVALAGANKSLTAENVSDGDGLVTAEKVLSLNLIGTRLVVLSACESGVGEISSGEGVFGLRRAFMQAGARGQVMSMWPVPDEQTRDLMKNFYVKAKLDTANPSYALRQAALDMMEMTRKQYGHANPYFWGAFVFVGNDGTVMMPFKETKNKFVSESTPKKNYNLVSPNNETLTINSSNNSNARFKTTQCRSIIDNNNNLEWFLGPNVTMGWDEASIWVSSLQECGGDWDMPTINQLSTLFEKDKVAGKGYCNNGKCWPAHIDPIFSGIGDGSWAWSKEEVNGVIVKSYNFNQGNEAKFEKNNKIFTTRTFAVRRVN